MCSEVDNGSRVLLYMLNAVVGELCLLEVLEVLEVMHGMLLYLLEALGMPEIMRSMLCMLEVVEGRICLLEVLMVLMVPTVLEVMLGLL